MVRAKRHYIPGYVRHKTFIEKMEEALGFRATGKKIICTDDTFELREVLRPYGKANNLDSGYRIESGTSPAGMTQNVNN